MPLCQQLAPAPSRPPGQLYWGHTNLGEHPAPEQRPIARHALSQLKPLQDKRTRGLRIIDTPDLIVKPTPNCSICPELSEMTEMSAQGPSSRAEVPFSPQPWQLPETEGWKLPSGCSPQAAAPSRAQLSSGSPRLRRGGPRGPSPRHVPRGGAGRGRAAAARTCGSLRLCAVQVRRSPPTPPNHPSHLQRPPPRRDVSVPLAGHDGRIPMRGALRRPRQRRSAGGAAREVPAGGRAGGWLPGSSPARPAAWPSRPPEAAGAAPRAAACRR